MNRGFTRLLAPAFALLLLFGAPTAAAQEAPAEPGISNLVAGLYALPTQLFELPQAAESPQMRVQVADAAQIVGEAQKGALLRGIERQRDDIAALQQAIPAYAPLVRALDRADVPLAEVIALDVRADGSVVLFYHPAGDLAQGR